jgi:hypothetical protein
MTSLVRSGTLPVDQLRRVLHSSSPVVSFQVSLFVAGLIGPNRGADASTRLALASEATAFSLTWPAAGLCADSD